MTIVEVTNLFLDYVSSTVLFEMADSRQDARSDVRNMREPIINHLLYLYLYPNSINKNHWLTELSTFFDKIDNLYLKPTGKRKLTGNDYYELLFRQPLEGDIRQLNKRLKRVVEKEGKPEVNYTSAEILEKLEKTLHSLSYDLSLDTYSSITDYLI